MSTIPTDFDPKNLGWRFLLYLPQFVRLFWRLAVLAKAILGLALAYVIAPIDLIPDMIGGSGEIDDLAIVILACRTFLSLCPPEVVDEHVRRIGGGTER